MFVHGLHVGAAKHWSVQFVFQLFDHFNLWCVGLLELCLGIQL